MSIASQRTLEEDVDVTFEAVAAAGRRLAPAMLRGPAQGRAGVRMDPQLEKEMR